MEVSTKLRQNVDPKFSNWSKDRVLFSAFANLFEFPGDKFFSDLDEIVSLLDLSLLEGKSSLQGKSQELLKEFRFWAKSASPEELEEKFVGTFDLRVLAYPYLGYHLFGESFKRGEFLSALVGKYNEHGFNSANEVFGELDTGELTEEIMEDGFQLKELPDHIKIVLRFLASLDDIDEAKILIDHCFIPAMSNMLAELKLLKKPNMDFLLADSDSELSKNDEQQEEQIKQAASPAELKFDPLKQLTAEQKLDRGLNTDSPGLPLNDSTCSTSIDSCSTCSPPGQGEEGQFMYKESEKKREIEATDLRNPYIKVLIALLYVLETFSDLDTNFLAEENSALENMEVTISELEEGEKANA